MVIIPPTKTVSSFVISWSSSNEIVVNSLVEHKVFGKGKVLKIEGIGDNSKLTIKFYNNVIKKLIYKYANLTIIKG